MSVVQMPSLLERLGSLTAIRDTELLEQSLLKTLATTLNLSDCALYRTNDKQDFLRVIHFHLSPGSLERVEVEYGNFELDGDTEELIAMVQRTVDHASRQRDHAVLNVYPLFGRAGINGYLVFESAQAVPLSHTGILRGVLQLYRNYYTLLDESQRDKLTGLLNRQALEQNLDRILATLATERLRGRPLLRPSGNYSPELRAQGDRRLWLAVIDVDHFKRINDEYGHVVGDEILLLIAQTMHACLRDDDLLYRYGGEEFIVITSTGEQEQQVAQLERLRQTVEARVFPQVNRVTVSIGYTALNSRLSAMEIIAHADKALYVAKKSGRNQLGHYDSLVASGDIAQDSYGSVELF